MTAMAKAIANDSYYFLTDYPCPVDAAMDTVVCFIFEYSLT